MQKQICLHHQGALIPCLFGAFNRKPVTNRLNTSSIRQCLHDIATYIGRPDFQVMATFTVFPEITSQGFQAVVQPLVLQRFDHITESQKKNLQCGDTLLPINHFTSWNSVGTATFGTAHHNSPKEVLA